MTIEPDKTSLNPGAALPPPQRGPSRRMKLAGAVIAVLAVGAAGGAAANRFVQHRQPQAVLLLQPAPIGQMKDATAVAVKGQVAEIFGNKFIVQDDSGRALVETGPRGDDGKLVKKGDAVTVQGRFDRGFIHAQVMTRADGTTEAFGPPRPEHGPHDDRGSGHGPKGPGIGPGMGPGNSPDRGLPPAN